MSGTTLSVITPEAIPSPIELPIQKPNIPKAFMTIPSLATAYPLPPSIEFAKYMYPEKIVSNPIITVIALIIPNAEFSDNIFITSSEIVGSAVPPIPKTPPG